MTTSSQKNEAPLRFGIRWELLVLLSAAILDVILLPARLLLHAVLSSHRRRRMIDILTQGARRSGALDQGSTGTHSRGS